MSDTNHIPDPVKGVINAFHKGSVLTKRICKAAQNALSTHTLKTLEPAQELERSLLTSEDRVKDAYAQGVRALGQGFAKAILNDHSLTNKLQSLAIKIRDDVFDLDDYHDEPDTFDYTRFKLIKEESEQCCNETINTLAVLQQQMLGARPRQTPQGDWASLSSIQSAGKRASSQSQATDDATTLRYKTHQSSGEEQAAWVNKPCLSEAAIPTCASYGSHHVSRERLELQSIPGEEQLRLIAREEVERQMSANEQLLEKRRKSRISFRQSMDIRNLSLNTASTTSTRPSLKTTSPRLIAATDFSASPIDNSRPNSTANFLSLAQSEGDNYHKSQALSVVYSNHGTGTAIIRRSNRPSPRKGSSNNSSHDSSTIRPRGESTGSELLFFGAPETPPLSSGRQSATEGWGDLAHTLKVPGFGDGVEDGKEVVNQPDYYPGIELAYENQNQPTPATSLKSIDFPIGPDSSFYLHGRFCESAKMLTRGEKGSLKVLKKPGVAENWAANVSMKCVKCAYEIGYDVYERDSALDRAGIYTIGEIRFRQRFLWKCHLPAKNTDDPAYACPFCIEEGKTVDEYDATVFFSTTCFFQHLQKHPRPTKAVDGLTVLYGLQSSSVLDFDVHFKTLDPIPSPFAELATKFTAMAAGHAIAHHRDRAKGYKDRDPDGKATLKFAQGARIVGITFPSRFAGAWAHGHHDSCSGNFPASYVTLDIPSKDNIIMNSRSTLSATARWDHKPKDSNTTWLSFSKGSKISNIGFPYQDAWCWTGQNTKGKWGVFPAAFVTGLREGAEPSSGKVLGIEDMSPGKGHGGSFSLSKLKSHTFQRRTTGGELSAQSSKASPPTTGNSTYLSMFLNDT